ncbi:MAG: hypothetical protein HYZ00_05255 [Candidatus Hydrogenedentes bacterium]|nr:hypothetical protein [Candidatus Hydrogenedentota bacterium]
MEASVAKRSLGQQGIHAVSFDERIVSVDVLRVVVSLALSLLLVAFLYRKRIFLRV